MAPARLPFWLVYRHRTASLLMRLLYCRWLRSSMQLELPYVLAAKDIPDPAAVDWQQQPRITLRTDEALDNLLGRIRQEENDLEACTLHSYREGDRYWFVVQDLGRLQHGDCLCIEDITTETGKQAAMQGSPVVINRCWRLPVVTLCSHAHAAACCRLDPTQGYTLVYISLLWLYCSLFSCLSLISELCVLLLCITPLLSIHLLMSPDWTLSQLLTYPLPQSQCDLHPASSTSTNQSTVYRVPRIVNYWRAYQNRPLIDHILEHQAAADNSNKLR